MRPELTHVAPGVVRLSWETDAPLPPLGTAVETIRGALGAAFDGGAERVEVYVDPDDEAAQRIVTWAGFMREGVARAVAHGADRIVYSRLARDIPVEQPGGFRALLNAFLPRKRAISQFLIRSTDERVLLCELTYKSDWDLPGGVVEVGESPQVAVAREVEEELGLALRPGPLVLTDWLPPWGGWDDAVCLVFDGGVHEETLLEQVVREEREIRTATFCTIEEVRERCADFTSRRIEAAISSLRAGNGPRYTESGR